MSVETSSAASDRRGADFESIFLALPPLGSAEYLDVLDKASVRELPAQVLARAFRQLATAGSDEAAEASLNRLVADSRFDYLKAIRGLAKKHSVRSMYAYSAEDLIQEAIMEIVKTLPTPRGAMAEGAWVRFTSQRFEDARRSLYGRDGRKDPSGRVEGVEIEEGEFSDPVEEVAGGLTNEDLWQNSDYLPWLEEFIRKTVAKIADPTIRRIAEDQFGEDPSPISKGKSNGGRPSLEEQLGLSRYQISRKLRSAKARLAAELLAQKERDIDVEWIKRFLNTDEREPKD